MWRVVTHHPSAGWKGQVVFGTAVMTRATAAT